MEERSVKSFVLSGMFASVTKHNLAAIAAPFGFRYQSHISLSSEILVLGDRWPLRKLQHGIDLTDKTKRAQAWRLRGHAIEVISESAFLSRLLRGADVNDATIARFHLADLVRHTGIRIGEVEKLISLGVLPPSDGKEIPSYDLVCLRSAIDFCAQFRRVAPKIDPKQDEAIDRALVRLKGIIPYAKQALEARRHSGVIGRRKESATIGPFQQLFLDFNDNITFPELAPLQLFESAWDADLLGDAQHAIEGYVELLERPDYHAKREVLFNLSSVYYRMGDFATAEAHLRDALVLDPTFADAWNNLGLCLSKTSDRHSEAVEALREALGLEPNFADVHFNLAKLLDQSGRGREAAPHWRAYLRADKDSPFAEHALSRLRTTEWVPAGHIVESCDNLFLKIQIPIEDEAFTQPRLWSDPENLRVPEPISQPSIRSSTRDVLIRKNALGQSRLANPTPDPFRINQQLSLFDSSSD